MLQILRIWRRFKHFVTTWIDPPSSRFTHEDVVAHGAEGEEISIDYEKALHMFDNVARDCMFVSKRYEGIAAPTAQHFYASVLFTALISRAVTLVVLAPHSPWADKIVEHWDYASAAGVVRTMTELRAAFHYLCIDACSEEEWNCRWNLLNLHDCVSRIRLLTANPSGDTSQIVGLNSQAEELRDKLRSNKFFSQLPHQKKLLNGQTAYLYPTEDLLEKAGLEKNTYRFLNILFSSAVHGLPMSYYRMGEQERGRGLPSPVEEGYTAICLSLATTLLASTRDEVEKLFDKMQRK